VNTKVNTLQENKIQRDTRGL